MGEKLEKVREGGTRRKEGGVNKKMEEKEGSREDRKGGNKDLCPTRIFLFFWVLPSETMYPPTSKLWLPC